MEDRYLFKAKRIDNGEWVQGYYVHTVESDYIVRPYEHTTLLGEGETIEIEVNTICQCTGLKDKNGKLIFENDLVEINGTIYQCFWDDANFEWGFKNNSEDFGIAYVSSDDIRIVGNIFDNPELLEVGE